MTKVWQERDNSRRANNLAWLTAKGRGFSGRASIKGEPQVFQTKIQPIDCVELHHQLAGNTVLSGRKGMAIRKAGWMSLSLAALLAVTTFTGLERYASAQGAGDDKGSAHRYEEDADAAHAWRSWGGNLENTHR